MRKKIEDILSPKQHAVWQYLAGVEEASCSDIVRATGIVEITVRQALNRLIALKRIKRIGLGRATRYRKLD